MMYETFDNCGEINTGLAIEAIAEEVHANAREKGFWDTERSDGELIALMHSELSEGLEALRKGLDSDHLPGFLGIEEEMADVIIRVLDYCAGRGLRIESAITAKMHYNRTRERMHGKKF